MESIRFADILLVFLTLVITFAILWQVDKAKRKSKETKENLPSGSRSLSEKEEG